MTKCAVVCLTISLSPIVSSYHLNNHILDLPDQYPYLGVLLDKKLSWSSHITNIANKANQTSQALQSIIIPCFSSSPSGICCSCLFEILLIIKLTSRYRDYSRGAKPLKGGILLPLKMALPPLNYVFNGSVIKL